MRSSIKSTSVIGLFFKFCAGHDSDTGVLCAKFQNILHCVTVICVTLHFAVVLGRFDTISSHDWVGLFYGPLFIQISFN